MFPIPQAVRLHSLNRQLPTQKDTTMIKVTIAYSGNSITKNVAAGTTVGSILTDANLKAVLGFGQNIEAQVNGASAESAVVLSDGDELDLVTKANTKAA